MFAYQMSPENTKYNKQIRTEPIDMLAAFGRGRRIFLLPHFVGVKGHLTFAQRGAPFILVTSYQILTYLLFSLEPHLD